MNKELYVSSTPHETRLALLEDGEVAELYFEREKEYSLAGAIYKGRVTRVLPGMQSAFVDVGLERDAFLYVSDFLEDSEEFDRVVSEAENAVEKLSQPSAPAEPARAAAEAAADAAETDEPAAPGLELAGPPPGTGEGEGEGFRRGRRRHRGRRGGTGIPDKKFARPGEHPAESAGQAPNEATGTRPEPSGRAVPSSEFR
ncbi:MAG: Rne/Rng family ribonuclease, partial [Terriglobales bacterium]